MLDHFEHDARAARLLLHERTGFAHDNASILLEQSRSPDEAVRKKAIEELAEVITNLGPDLSQKDEMRDLFYSEGGDPNQQLQCCACCGVRDFKLVLHGKLYDLNDEWCGPKAILHLNDAEKAKYVYSRVAGYLNLTVLKFVACSACRLSSIASQIYLPCLTR